MCTMLFFLTLQKTPFISIKFHSHRRRFRNVQCPFKGFGCKHTKVIWQTKCKFEPIYTLVIVPFIFTFLIMFIMFSIWFFLFLLGRHFNDFQLNRSFVRSFVWVWSSAWIGYHEWTLNNFTNEKQKRHDLKRMSLSTHRMNGKQKKKRKSLKIVLPNTIVWL